MLERETTTKCEWVKNIANNFDVDFLVHPLS